MGLLWSFPEPLSVGVELLEVKRPTVQVDIQKVDSLLTKVYQSIDSSTRERSVEDLLPPVRLSLEALSPVVSHEDAVNPQVLWDVSGSY